MLRNTRRSFDTVGYPKAREDWISGEWEAMQREVRASAEASFVQTQSMWLWLSLIVALGALLRFYGLGVQSMWQDELSGWYRSHFSTLQEVWIKGVLTDNHPPGMHILSYLVQRLWGDSDVLLRLPSAIAGTLSIWLIYWAGKKLFSPLEGSIAAAMMAVFHTPLYYSQEARPYAMLIAFTLASLVCWLHILDELLEERNPSKWYVVGYILAASLSLYFHHFGVIFTGLLALWSILRLVVSGSPSRWQALLYLGGIYLVIAFLYIPWLPSALIQLQTPGDSFAWAYEVWMTPPLLDVVLRVLQLFYSNPYFYESSDPLLAVVLVIFAVALLSEIANTIRTRKALSFRRAIRSPNLLIFYLLVMPFLLSYLISVTVFLIFSDRNLLISLPVAYILLARSITRIGEWIGRRQLASMIITFGLVGLTLYQMLFVMEYYQRPVKEQFRDAVAHVVENGAKYPDSLIIGGNSRQQMEYVNYYMRHLGSDRRLALPASQEADIGKVKALLQNKQPRYIWFVSVHKSPDKALIKFLDDVGDLLEKQRYIDASVRLYAFEPEKLSE